LSKVVFNISFTSKNPPASLYGMGRAKYAASRKFYDLTAGYNYFSYMLNGQKAVKNKDAARYYARNEKDGDPNNTGLFNADGRIAREKMEEIKKSLAKTGSIVWHGFISFDAETSKGFATQEQAIRFLKHSFNDFIAKSHLKRGNTELFAALHEDTAHHHHIHFSFFEKQPHRNKNGELTYTKRGSFPQKLLDNYLVSANMHLSDNSYDYYTARDRAMEKLKEIRAAGAEVYRDRELNEKLSVLARKLPAAGRLSYGSEDMKPFRAEIDALANALIRGNPDALAAHREVLEQIAAREREAVRIARENRVAYAQGARLTAADVRAVMGAKSAGEIRNKGIPAEFVDAGRLDIGQIEYIKRLREDYRTRVGNQIVGLLKDMKRDVRAEQRRAKANDRQLKIDARRHRARGGRLMLDFMRALGAQNGVQADFMKHMRQIEHENEREIAAGRMA
jgi:hypothetical protein